MRSIKLEEIIPSEATLELPAVGKTITLRPIDLDDEVWIKATFDDLNDMFQKAKMPELCRLAWHQMKPEDREFFAVRDIPYLDENGEQKTVRRGGVELLRGCIRGQNEKNSLLKALLQTIGISQPMLEDFEAEAVAELKKKEAKLNEIRARMTPVQDELEAISEIIESKQIGDASSTPSRVSTVGQSRKSAS
jgi:hypothetical protein